MDAANAKAPAEVQYVTDAEGRPVGVIVPIELWREIESERETQYLLASPVMRDRLLGARAQEVGVSLDEARARLGM